MITKIFIEAIETTNPVMTCHTFLAKEYIDRKYLNNEILISNLKREWVSKEYKKAVVDAKQKGVDQSTLDVINDKIHIFLRNIIGGYVFVSDDGFWVTDWNAKKIFDEGYLQYEKVKIAIAANDKDNLLLNFNLLANSFVLSGTKIASGNAWNVGGFSVEELAKLGVIKEEKEFFANTLISILESLKSNEELKNEIVNERNILVSFRAHDKSVFNKFIEIYGDIEKDGNKLLLKIIERHDGEMLKWIMPLINSIKIGDSKMDAYDLAIKESVDSDMITFSEFQLDGLLGIRDKEKLKGLVISKNKNRDDKVVSL